MQPASHRDSHTHPDSAQTQHTTSIATKSAPYTRHITTSALARFWWRTSGSYVRLWHGWRPWIAPEKVQRVRRCCGYVLTVARCGGVIHSCLVGCPNSSIRFNTSRTSDIAWLPRHCRQASLPTSAPTWCTSHCVASPFHSFVTTWCTSHCVSSVQTPRFRWSYMLV